MYKCHVETSVLSLSHVHTYVLSLNHVETCVILLIMNNLIHI